MIGWRVWAFVLSQAQTLLPDAKSLPAIPPAWSNATGSVDPDREEQMTMKAAVIRVQDRSSLDSDLDPPGPGGFGPINEGSGKRADSEAPRHVLQTYA